MRMYDILLASGHRVLSSLEEELLSLFRANTSLNRDRLYHFECMRKSYSAHRPSREHLVELYVASFYFGWIREDISNLRTGLVHYIQ